MWVPLGAHDYRVTHIRRLGRVQRRKQIRIQSMSLAPQEKKAIDSYVNNDDVKKHLTVS